MTEQVAREHLICCLALMITSNTTEEWAKWRRLAEETQRVVPEQIAEDHPDVQARVAIYNEEKS